MFPTGLLEDTTFAVGVGVIESEARIKEHLTKMSRAGCLETPLH